MRGRSSPQFYLGGSISGTAEYFIKAVISQYCDREMQLEARQHPDTSIQLIWWFCFLGWTLSQMDLKHVRLLSEELTALFPGQLIVERSRRVVLVGLIWRRREGHKLGVHKQCGLRHYFHSLNTTRIFPYRSILATTHIQHLAALRKSTVVYI